MADEPISETEDELDAKLPIFDAKEHADRFDPEAYFKVGLSINLIRLYQIMFLQKSTYLVLQAFYKTPHEEGAMTMILFFLPSFAYRLLQEKHLLESGTLLDVGSGEE